MTGSFLVYLYLGTVLDYPSLLFSLIFSMLSWYFEGSISANLVQHFKKSSKTFG